jgi:hypothetical protein
MSKARQLADNGAATPNRNMVINGAMNIAQRSTSVGALGATSGYYTVDRFRMFFLGTAGRLTMSQTADGPSGFANCIKLDCSTPDTSIAAGELLILQTILEGQNLQRIKKGTSDAEQVTVSFYVKANAAATYSVELFQNSANNRHIAKDFSVTTAWTKVELVYPADTTEVFVDDNSAQLQLNIWLHAGTSFTGGTFNTNAWAAEAGNTRANSENTSFFDADTRTFFITGVQFEVGPSATPFEHEDYNTTLQKCLRYYENNCDLGHYPVHDIAFGNTNSPFFMHGFLADNMRMNYRYTVEKRGDPAATFYTVTGLGNGATENRWDFWTGSAWNQCDGETRTDEITSKGMILNQVEADLVLDRSYMTAGCFELDAEL